MALRPLFFLSAALLWLVPRAAHAQYFGGLALEGGVPLGEFRHYANGGGGVHVEGGWVNGFLPLRAGARLGLFGYGIDMPEIPPAVQMMQMAPGADIDTGLSGRIWSGDLFVRLQPTHQFIEPYLEGSVGGAFFEQSVQYSHVDKDGQRSPDGTSSILGTDYRFGLGTGIAFMFAQHPNGEGGLELGVRWLLGSDTHVPGITSITHAWPPTHSRTDLLLFSLGGSIAIF